MKKKFADAFNGLKTAFNHKAVSVQFILGLCAIIGGFIIRLDFYEWLAFIICIMMVTAAEVFNTAVENIGNYLNTETDERIRIIKDLSSGAVLLCAGGSLIICILCVIRRLVS